MTARVPPPRPACETFQARNAHAAYLAGQLDADETVAFENHFLTCAFCQSQLTSVVPERELGRRLGRRSAWVASGLAAAALLAAVLAWPRDDTRHLGAIGTAPIYLGVDVRAEGGQASALFDRGMEQYQAEAYARAARTLEQALAAGAPTAPTAFFRGAAQLMNDDAGAAIESFSQVIRAGQTPYLDEARFYRAKALLRKGDAAAALRDLRRIPAAHPLSGEARGLIGRIAP